MAKLTPKQQRFVQEYLIDLNGAGAARRAGYSERNADNIAHELLGKTQVRDAIVAAQAERSARVAVSADYVVRTLIEVVERSMQRAPVVTMRGDQVVDDEGRSVWRFDGKTATRALELLGRHLGMFTDRLESDVKQNVKVVLFGGE